LASRSDAEQERRGAPDGHGTQDVFRRGRGNGMIVIDEVKCIFIIGNFNAIEVVYPSFTLRSGQFKIVWL
jgi:hypothetical protein